MGLYHLEQAPDLEVWRSMTGAERWRVVQHALSHTLVADRVLAGDRAVIRALQRLQGEGMSRHNAIHAIADLLIRFMRQQHPFPTPAEQSQAQRQLNAALDALTAVPVTMSKD